MVPMAMAATGLAAFTTASVMAFMTAGLPAAAGSLATALAAPEACTASAATHSAADAAADMVEADMVEADMVEVGAGDSRLLPRHGMTAAISAS